MAVPKIRIKGYTDEWKNQFVKSICDISTGKSNTQDKIIDGKYPFYVRSSNIERSNKYLYDEEAVLTAGDGVGTGKVFHYVNGKYDLHQRVYRMFNFRDIDSKFFFHIFSSKFYERVMSMTAKSSVDSVRYDMISDMEITVPNVITEQEAIADYFKSLDSLIEATDKKIATLKQTKQASLQSMFPQEGETKPRVRFKGFTDDWKKVEIGKYGDTYSGLSGKSKDDFGKGNAKYITFLNVLTNAQINTYILESVDVKTRERQNAVQKGDILFNTSSETPEEVGLCSVLLEDIPNVYLNSFCFGFRPNNPAINSEFLVYLMRGHIGRSIMKVLAQGATRYNLSKKRLCETLVPIPTNIDEQKQIAEYFSNLDKQISIQEQRLEKLKQIKSACLKNMFV
jgi:type I restriction enzyme S subunit